MTTAIDGFAVIDIETTGLSPQSDRVIELAIVHVDPMGAETGRFETLINPGRDLGPQRRHGIRAGDVLGAPSFADVAAELIGLLDGRVAVAHHAAFVSRFLFAEFERSGIGVWNRPAFLCTMQLARHFLPGSGRALRDCCAAYDIRRDGSAPGDRTTPSRSPSCSPPTSRDARRDPRLAVPFTGLVGGRWPATAAPARPIPWKARPAVSAQTSAVYLGTLADRLPPITVSDDDSIEYLALLDRALIDRVLTVPTAAELAAFAEQRGIGRRRRGATASRVLRRRSRGRRGRTAS